MLMVLTCSVCKHRKKKEKIVQDSRINYYSIEKFGMRMIKSQENERFSKEEPLIIGD